MTISFGTRGSQVQILPLRPAFLHLGVTTGTDMGNETQISVLDRGRIDHAQPPRQKSGGQMCCIRREEPVERQRSLPVSGERNHSGFAAAHSWLDHKRGWRKLIRSLPLLLWALSLHDGQVTRFGSKVTC